MELKMVLTALALEFDISFAEGATTEPLYKMSFTLVAGPLRLRLTPVKHDVN
jgi:hypothetical protein